QHSHFQKQKFSLKTPKLVYADHNATPVNVPYPQLCSHMDYTIAIDETLYFLIEVKLILDHRLLSLVFLMIFLSVSFFASAILCGAGLYILSSLLPSSFLAARFNSRSNHSVAARQIGGLALIPAIVLSLVLFGTHLGLDSRMMLCLSGASLLLWIIGALDDRFELSVKTRFAAQFIAACLILYGMGADFRLFPELLPHSVEIIILIIALIASINITNFMDGLDLMTVGGIGTPLLGVAILAALTMTDAGSGAIAAITAGGLLGF